jgi:hypothetical protein
MSMFKPTTLAATAAIALLAGAAQAQQATTTATTGLHEAQDEAMIVQPLNLSVEKLEDMDLSAAGGEDVGDVEEVLVDASGQPVAIAADVGGFLGIGDKTVVIGLDQLRMEGDRLVTGMTKEQMEALPEWDD